jgi:hypothetical protein
MLDPVPVGQGTAIKLFDVNRHEPRQELVAVGARWDSYIVGRVDDRQLEGNQEIFGLKAVSLRR